MSSKPMKKRRLGTKSRKAKVVVRVNSRGGLSVVDTQAYLNSPKIKKLIGDTAKIQTSRN